MITLGFMLSATLALFGLWFAYRHRHVPGALSFMAVCALVCWTAVASGFEYTGVGLEQKLFWRNAQQPGYYFLPVAVLALSAAYASEGGKIAASKLALLSIAPAAAVLLLFTDESHHWMRASIAWNGTGQLVIERTLLSQLFINYNFLLNIVSLGLLTRALLTAKGRPRKQLAFLASGVALPCVISLLRTFGMFPITGYAALTAITYVPASVIMMWGIFKYQLLQVVPIGRSALVDAMKEGIVVLDADKRVLDANVSARRMVAMLAGRSEEPLEGRSFADVLPSADAWLGVHDSRKEGTIELASGLGEEGYYWTVRVMPIWRGEDRFGGSVSVITDMTDIKRRERELRRTASIDALTGVYNRAAFVERTEKLMKAAAVMDQPVSLLLMDIDEFKPINDRYGRRVGDEAIRAFARAVEPCLDRTHVFGRIGGEEFAVALPGVALDGAAALADAIRQAVERTRVAAGDRDIRMTVSIGAACGAAGELFDRLLAEADRRLYRAKRGGRNRVAADDDTEAVPRG
ncbi:diguanylate cyclase [Paenibacillus sp.]|uniref:histidine kinase N-terminal 7TM domain-containing diguanylate cyclase n=1 Tax=Paenibacillus sp. TaxID=58172 RepID=UPI002D425FD1|nr:diguanylate cyclase [Paenibacillus sp.]HZG86456.1 diguanylate cyclase [Paenibacillus sp.]